MTIQIVAVIATSCLALLVLYKTVNNNFRPYASTRIALWLSGFITGYCLLWLMVGDTFFSNLGFKLFAGVIIGLIWAFQVASGIEAARKRTKIF